MTRTGRRGPWLPEEDQTLLRLVRSQGPNNWVRISQHMQHRSPKQCRERYHQNLKPSLNHEPITAQEGELIEQMVHEMGNRWAEIARRLGNRSDNAIKNWWNGSMNRRKRHLPNSHVLKTQVGPRTQPIHATKPDRQSCVEEQQQRSGHPSYRLWSRDVDDEQSPRHTQHVRPTSSYPHVEHRTLTEGANHHDQFPRSYWQHLPSIRSHYSYHHDSRIQHPPPPSPQHTHPPSLWPISRTPVEPPLVSPVGSELSHAPSLRGAPSLVSDNLSNYSVSPKTVPSPRPTMPAPICTNTRDWTPRDTPSLFSGPISPSRQHQMLPLPGDEGYVSAHPVSGGLDRNLCVFGETLPQPQPQLSYVYAPTTREPMALLAPLMKSDLPSPSDMSPNGARDSRMHVASILG